jgi:hypothetical protein
VKIGDRVRVVAEAPHYGGRVGYVRGFGSGPYADGTVIVAEVPSRKDRSGRYVANDYMFVIELKYIVPEP